MKLFKFYADWCEPCKRMTPIVESVSKKLYVDLETVDIEQSLDLCNKYNVRGIPTYVITDGETTVARSSGVMSEEAFEDWVLKHTSSNL